MCLFSIERSTQSRMPPPFLALTTIGAHQSVGVVTGKMMALVDSVAWAVWVAWEVLAAWEEWEVWVVCLRTWQAGEARVVSEA